MPPKQPPGPYCGKATGHEEHPTDTGQCPGYPPAAVGQVWRDADPRVRKERGGAERFGQIKALTETHVVLDPVDVTPSGTIVEIPGRTVKVRIDRLQPTSTGFAYVMTVLASAGTAAAEVPAPSTAPDDTVRPTTPDWSVLRDQVRARSGYLGCTVADLLPFEGVVRAREAVMDRISWALDAQDIGHLPPVLPPDRNRYVLLYDKQSGVGALVHAVCRLATSAAPTHAPSAFVRATEMLLDAARDGHLGAPAAPTAGSPAREPEIALSQAATVVRELYEESGMTSPELVREYTAALLALHSLEVAAQLRERNFPDAAAHVMPAPDRIAIAADLYGSYGA
ncbi:hypothetical protein ACIP5N_33330 [Streptomyces sp. NPDC088768]|uniref:hypothetical protein n=1 Tax=Streptomyces sp. NPDC088768 TaxID=3365894 RepID=UPI003801F07D